MNLDNPNGIESSVSKKNQQRRTFLIKASAVTVVASLPLRSSWASVGGTGCSVSGNLSGNLSQDCSGAGLFGQSPEQWILSGDSELTNTWSTIFAGAPFGTTRSSSDLVSTILSDGNLGGDLNAALLAAYFNAKDGFYGALTVSPSDYANGLYAQVNNGVSEAQMLNAIESTY